MTPQERELIQGVFDRLARSGVGTKDAEADALIRELTARQPDTAYGLVQAVIVQEMGLNQAQQKITELQRQLDDARAHTAAQPAVGGGFLGGFNPWGGGSVPRSGAPNAAPSQAQTQFTPVWGGAPQVQQQQPGAWGQQQPSSGAGGFLRNAASMAAGVAGGTLIAEGLSSLFGGHRGGFGGMGGAFGGGTSPWGSSSAPSEIVENTTVNNYYGDKDKPDDSGVQDASYDDGSYDDGGDYGGDDSSDV
jgi:hypothetical protein